MSEAWSYFAIVFLVQFLLFLIHAYYEKKLPDVPRILGRGVLGGIVLGLSLDLVFGKFLGLFSYTLGFGMFSLILNAALLYGLFAANALLMREARLPHFFIWTILVGAIFEVTNLFFRLWTWKFALLSGEFLTIFLLGNLGAAILVALVWHVFFGERFVFITDLTRRRSLARKD